MSENTPAKQTSAPPAKFADSTADQVLANISKLQEAGELRLPPDYSAENAIRSAWLMIQEVENKDKKKAVDICTRPSIANAMLDMVLQGLSPVKKQCYFIVYGDKLMLSRSYIGTYAVARRVAKVVDAVANVVYEGDDFKFEIDNRTGRKNVVSHAQSLDNINTDKIRGVYATVIMEDGSSYVEIMTMPQVRKAWAQGQTKGDSPAHKNFPEEMAKKSCIGRALKLLIGGSDDSGLFDEDESLGDPVQANVMHEIKTNGNRQPISMSNPPVKPKSVQSNPAPKEYIQEEPQQAKQPDPVNEEPPY